MVALESSKLFRQLPAAELAKLKQVARELSFASGQEIFKAGDPSDGAYLVKSGHVQISTVLATGERYVFSEVLPGEIFGEMSLLDSQPRSAFASAQGETTVYFVPREPMVGWLKHSPELALRLVQEISERLRLFNHQYVRQILQAERMALVGRFASSIVHDLKNPLSIINLAAEFTAAPDATAAERAQAQGNIAKQVEYITAMINDILDFTRGGQSTLPFSFVDYADFVHAIVTETTPQLAQKAVRIEMENPAPAVRLALNPKRLSRVFFNLFGNAADMMPQGGAIKLRFNSSECDVTTEVADTGPGIAPQVADRLFDAFVTFGKPKGTGLGLSIVRRIIEEHGGKIWARNEPGGGAVFAFALPRTR